ncbi:MAG: ligand-gated ion channel [Planctomycetota bacterium]|jgi:hypothetical protein
MIAPLLLALATGPVPPPPPPAQADCEVPRHFAGSPPETGAGPLPIDVRLFVVDVIEMNEVQEATTLDFFLSARWHDPRLSAESLGRSLDSCRLEQGDIWDPALFFINRRRLFPDPAQVTVDGDGNVVWRQRFYGELSQSLELRRLPFDRQQLLMRVSSAHTTDQVELRCDPASGLYEGAALPGWIVEDFRASASKEFVPGPDVTISVVEGRIAVHRDLGFYGWRLFLPLALITLMASAVFYIPPGTMGPRVGVATASVFSLLAFLIGTRNFVPRISYLTVAEKLNVAAMAMVFLALAIAITGGSLAERGKEELAIRIERKARWMYPLLGMLIAAFILGRA